MVTFYVLPPTPMVGDLFAGYLKTWLPGLDWDTDTRENLAEAVRSAAECRPDVYVIFREDLPEGQATDEALRDAFGAEQGDEVIEVRPAPSAADHLRATRRQIRDAA
jgi:hypothetical protein